MAGPDGQKADGLSAAPLVADMASRATDFDFFGAVRRLECAHAHLPRVGHSRLPSEDVVRFSQEVSLAFAPSTVRALEARAAPAGVREAAAPGPGAAPRMVVGFMGLLGPNGPLPLHLTEHVHDGISARGDAAMARFLDVFNHRMVSLFYRAWASCQKTVHLEREHDAAQDRFSAYIASLIGMAMPSLRHRDRVQDSAKLFFAGRLASQTRCAEGLEAVLQDYFGAPVRVEEFVGQWLPLPEDCRLRLGADPASGRLGSTAIVGSSVWECQQKFRVRMGPLGLEEFERMLPVGEARGLGRMTDWCRLYAGDELCWDLRLVLRAGEVPATRLGSSGRLGWTTWARSGPETRDRDDLVLRPLS